MGSLSSKSSATSQHLPGLEATRIACNASTGACGTFGTVQAPLGGQFEAQQNVMKRSAVRAHERADRAGRVLRMRVSGGPARPTSMRRLARLGTVGESVG